jgi:hypothetical protein
LVLALVIATQDHDRAVPITGRDNPSNPLKHAKTSGRSMAHSLPEGGHTPPASVHTSAPKENRGKAVVIIAVAAVPFPTVVFLLFLWIKRQRMRRTVLYRFEGGIAKRIQGKWEFLIGTRSMPSHGRLRTSF